MTISGRFIVVEGLEGAGKTTAIATIKHYLETRVPHLILTREPGGTLLGEDLRRLIKERREGESLDPRAEVLMLYAARVQLLEEVIRPALHRGDWVVSDRFELSTYAYQLAGRGIHQNTLDYLSAMCLQGFKPDLILFLDIKPEDGLFRISKRKKLDRIEQESLVFFNRVYQGYHERIRDMDNVQIIDASATLDKVHNAIIAHMTHFMAYHV